MEHSTELPKSFANRIARAAFSEDAANITRLLLLSGYLGGLLGSASDQPSGDCTNDQSQEGDLPPVMTNAKQVGIWECREEGGKTCFVRRKDLFKEWHLWADIERIEPKGGKQRIVLIGESVARGFIYDPAFNPAIALEAILQSRLGENEVEVIDLARTNIGYEVGELAASALLLDPDLVVIFAGNNWGISFPEPAEVVSMDAILRAQGIAGVKLLAEAQIERNARNVVNTIAGILGSRNVPLVWVIPEFNLGDWREPLTTAPYLLDNLNREWTAAYGEAQNALNRGDLGRASELAKRMVEIDGGVCAAGFYILAECSRQRRESKALRHYLELARDAVIWDSSRLTVPRSLALVQEILRNEAGNHKTQIVDLPKLFEEHLQGGIPGRQLFLDYCHLTSEGIQIAMSAVASCALQLLKEMRVPWNALAGECILPIGEIEAEASFLAAIHNAHWSQPYEPIHYHCLRSLHLSPHIGPLMINYIELQTQRTAPLLMCRSAEQLADLGSPLISRYLLPRSQKQFDGALLNAMVDALNRNGTDIREWFGQIRRDQLGVNSGEIDVLDFFYSSSADQPQEMEWARPIPEDGVPLKQANYYKAYHPYSRFVFVGEAGYSLQLCLTCRLPKQAPYLGMAVVEINEMRQAQITISREWETWEILVSGEAVRQGVNEIMIRWPVHEFDSNEAFERVIEELFQWKNPEFYYVFGEIHSFTVSGRWLTLREDPPVQDEPTAV